MVKMRTLLNFPVFTGTLCLLIFFAAPSTGNNLQISSGFERISEFRDGTRAKVYFASTFAANQDEALVLCQERLGGQLVAPKSRAEFEAVINSAPSSSNDYQTYFTAGRNVGGTWFWLTTGEIIPSSLLFWGDLGIWPFGVPGRALTFWKYNNVYLDYYFDAFGPHVLKRFVCEVDA